MAFAAGCDTRPRMKTFSFQVDPLTGEQFYEVYLRGR